MRNKIGLFLILLVVLSFSAKKDLQSISGKWTLICYENFLSNNKDCRPPDEYFNGSLSFTFEDDGIHGDIKGRSVTNEVYGDYQLLQNQRIIVTRFGGTKVMEHGWGSDFWGNIRKSNSYQFKSDTLMIYYEDDTKAMIFVPHIE
jgi:hypothetical protein